MLLLKTNSYFKLFQYAKAAETDKILLTTYRRLLDSSRGEDLESKFIIHNGLQDVPPQQTYIRESTTFPWKRNKIGIVEIPLSRDSTQYDAIFDNMALYGLNPVLLLRTTQRDVLPFAFDMYIKGR